MTNKNSAIRVLRQQADQMAYNLKRAERNDPRVPPGLLKARKEKPSINFAVVMDDKIIKIEMAWRSIELATECQISDLILAEMQK